MTTDRWPKAMVVGGSLSCMHPRLLSSTSHVRSYATCAFLGCHVFFAPIRLFCTQGPSTAKDADTSVHQTQCPLSRPRTTVRHSVNHTWGPIRTWGHKAGEELGTKLEAAQVPSDGCSSVAWPDWQCGWQAGPRWGKGGGLRKLPSQHHIVIPLIVPTCTPIPIRILFPTPPPRSPTPCLGLRCCRRVGSSC